MLCRRHALAIEDHLAGRLIPDRLTTAAHAGYRVYAERVLDVYRRGVGQPRGSLHAAVRAVLGNDPHCPPRRGEAFCKLLDDVSTYGRSGAVEAASLRQAVFRAASALHPLSVASRQAGGHSRDSATRVIAQQLGRPWIEIERDLFADVFECHRLQECEGYADGRALLSRYNIAQQQAALYDAVSMTVRAGQDFKTILRYAKLAGLMHTVSRCGHARYEFRFDGPASTLRRSARYGVALARFLPALIACRDWSLTAIIRRRKRQLRLELSSDDGLKSTMPAPNEFDSSVERVFAETWGHAPRDGWTLIREGTVLSRGQKAFVPDFALQHECGVRVLLEIAGYWTPEYLQAKRETLQMFADTKILLAVCARNAVGLGDLVGDPIVYRTALRVEDVLQRLRQFVHS